MLDFVILFHQVPDHADWENHWDLMMRDGDRLLTWALKANPLETTPVVGQRLADHRIEYLVYEGEVSGGRGMVNRIARGTYLNAIDPAEDWDTVLMMAGGRRILLKCRDDREFEFMWLA